MVDGFFFLIQWVPVVATGNFDHSASGGTSGLGLLVAVANGFGIV